MMITNESKHHPGGYKKALYTVKAKTFMFEYLTGQDSTGMLQWNYSILMIFPFLYSVLRPDSWDCSSFFLSL